jgi:LysR family transcriptional regulator, low CO2-responsive transcriptional regulator
MNLDYLHTFLEVLKHGSFSKVARELGISQPAVSFQIQKLESELGISLLDRRQKRLHVTTAGRRLVEFAELVTSNQASLTRDLDALREEITGELRVGASTMPGEYLLPPLLGEFRKLHPGIRAQVTGADSGAVIAGIKSGDFELGFTGLEPHDRELASFRFASDEIVLIVYPEHPLAARREVKINEIESEPLIFRGADSGTQKSLKTRLSEAGYDIRRWEPAMVMGSTQAVINAVAARSGIAFVSNLAIASHLDAGTIRRVALSGIRIERDFYGIHRKGGLTIRRYREFAAFVKASRIRPD